MKLKAFEKWSLGSVALFAYLSGVVLFVLNHWARVASAVGEQHLPVERAVRVAHSALTYLLVLALGYLIKLHVVPGMRQKNRRPSGVFLLLLFVILLATAVVTLYAGEGEWVATVSLVHAMVGIFFPVFLLLHRFKRFSSVKSLNPGYTKKNVLSRVCRVASH